MIWDQLEPIQIHGVVYVTPKVQTSLEYRLGSWYIRPDVLEYQLSLYFRSSYIRTSSYSRSWYSRPKASHITDRGPT